MNCDGARPLLSELVNGTLDSPELWQVQAHIAVCPECSVIAGDFAKIRVLLRETDVPAMSETFEKTLLSRVAGLSSDQKSDGNKPKIARRFTTASMKYMLAFSAAAVIMIVAIFTSWNFESAPRATSVSDAPLVHQCIEQHRSDVAVQPLSDWAAQNLANQLDRQSGQSTAGDDGSI